MDKELTGLTQDAFLGGALTICQPQRGFRSGLDAVVLAASIPARAGEHALEAGLGVGVASLCLLRRVPGLRVTGLEAHAETATLAADNALHNHLQDQLEIHQGSIEAPPVALRQRVFDHVFANPPFLESGEGVKADGEMRAGARMGPPGTLGAWVDFCVRRAAPGASVTVLHRADRLDRLLAAFGERCGGVQVFPLWPKAGVPAKRVLVRAIKGSRRPLTMLSGLVLHEADGAFTGEADAILRRGAPLAALAPHA